MAHKSYDFVGRCEDAGLVEISAAAKPWRRNDRKYDAIRAANPTLAISIYGLEPGGPVVLEVIDPEGFTASWAGSTAEAVLAMAFPGDVLDAVENEVKALLAAQTPTEPEFVAALAKNRSALYVNLDAPADTTPATTPAPTNIFD